MPEIIDYKIPRWFENKLAYGSYSYVKVGGKFEAYNVMAEPVGKTLFFAGEHTNIDYPQSVHGAYMSGERAAIEILDALDKKLIPEPTPTPTPSPADTSDTTAADNKEEELNIILN